MCTGSANETNRGEGAILEALPSRCGVDYGEDDASHVHGTCGAGEHEREISETVADVRQLPSTRTRPRALFPQTSAEDAPVKKGARSESPGVSLANELSGLSSVQLSADACEPGMDECLSHLWDSAAGSDHESGAQSEGGDGGLASIESSDSESSL